MLQDARQNGSEDCVEGPRGKALQGEGPISDSVCLRAFVSKAVQELLDGSLVPFEKRPIGMIHLLFSPRSELTVAVLCRPCFTDEGKPLPNVLCLFTGLVELPAGMSFW